MSLIMSLDIILYVFLLLFYWYFTVWHFSENAKYWQWKRIIKASFLAK